MVHLSFSNINSKEIGVNSQFSVKYYFCKEPTDAGKSFLYDFTTSSLPVGYLNFYI